MKFNTTQPTLLDRMRNPADHAAWAEFDACYGDLILRYCLRRGLQYVDAEDVRQRVFISLTRAIPVFDYNPERGRFRSYLGQAVRRAIVTFLKERRPTTTLSSLSTESVAMDPGENESMWDREWVDHHYRMALRTIRATLEPKSIRVFDHLLAGRTVRETAQEFQMTEEAVYKVKQRVRDQIKKVIERQIRQEESHEREELGGQ